MSKVHEHLLRERAAVGGDGRRAAEVRGNARLGRTTREKTMKSIIAGGLCVLAGFAQAAWIQSVGQSERCISMGGACVAKADDYGAYYHNPAATTAFKDPLVGGNFRILDTTNLDLIDSAGEHDIPQTNTEAKLALAPTLAGYYPLGERIVLGLGLGAPFAITADWTNDDGLHRYNMSNQALFVLDLTPTVAFKINEQWSVGVGLNIIALKHLKLETLIPLSFGAALPPALGGAGAIIPTTPDSEIIGSLSLETSDDARLGIPPDNFAAAFDEFALTFGVEYKMSEWLRFGAVYRTATDSEWEGDLTAEIGGAPQTVGFNLDLDMPAHLQVGMAYEIIPEKLDWSFDIQWTRWSAADGIGTPAVIKFDAPLVGFINDLELDYDGSDTFTFRTGLEVNLTSSLSLILGYARDGAIFDDSRVDILTYDSDRNIYSIGMVFDRRETQFDSGLMLMGGVQAIMYDSRKIRTGKSQNLGGVSLPNLLDQDTLTFTANRGDFEYGGAIWAVGVSFEYGF